MRGRQFITVLGGAASDRTVGKIACRIVAAWARRANDFAHADERSDAPLPTLRSAGKVIE
jgi:hypothetical protein